MNKNFDNAFPATPVQDKFGQIGFPNIGLTKVEYYAIEIFKAYYDPKQAIQPETLFRICTDDAINFLTFIDKTTKILQNEKTDKLDIIQS
jgi:hypothetical protein